ncbi:MAG TPA: uroporphyrinogen-III C-methyltransferase [Gammaproteobacteria bacterium]|nr:uroporphyrinogen-III C-methyltransferase [Gammaproteobacteria bacterium]MCH78032.1 uroporphyrinogen-III C-methyltransferase [Gammaproteobacteria bacterium]
MDYLPIFLDVRGRSCLVVGGGAVAARKLSLLLRAGARGVVVAPQIGDELRELAGPVELRERAFAPDDLAGMTLAIAATDDAVVNAEVAAQARARGLPVNVVDTPDLCSFIMPAVVDRSPVIAAVSSGGRAPVLTRLLRARLETLIPAAYGRLAQLAGSVRGTVRARIDDPVARRRFWDDALQGPVAELALSGQDVRARQLLDRLIERGAAGGVGEVYLVGAGPGDPDLLTFRALRLLQQADVIVYDRLVAPEILDMARREAERIDAGKRASEHTLPQEDINALLVRLARDGKRVLRLKGGDPFIFGRGGEEIEQLAAAGIPFQVVPGITAASGCASYAGIPLTHRDYAQSVRFLTGHRKDGQLDLDWQNLAAAKETLVFYMGLNGLTEICEGLIAHGMAGDTPAALIERGTRPDQRIVLSDLQQLPFKVSDIEVQSPSLLIIGNVVRLQEKLAWYGETLKKQIARG